MGYLAKIVRDTGWLDVAPRKLMDSRRLHELDLNYLRSLKHDVASTNEHWLASQT
jgi:hypothetical protein